LGDVDGGSLVVGEVVRRHLPLVADAAFSIGMRICWSMGVALVLGSSPTGIRSYSAQAGG